MSKVLMRVGLIGFACCTSTIPLFAERSPRPIQVDWQGLEGEYVGTWPTRSDACQVQIVIDSQAEDREILSIVVSFERGEVLSWQAPLSKFQRSLSEGSYAAGTAAHVSVIHGHTLKRHTELAGTLSFAKPKIPNDVWSLRSVELAQMEADSYLVLREANLSCTNLQKVN